MTRHLLIYLHLTILTLACALLLVPAGGKAAPDLSGIPGTYPPAGAIRFMNPADPRPLGDFKSLTIPLKRAGRLLLIEARIDTVTGNLIFDTGASALVLNRTYFRKGYRVDDASSGGITGAGGEVYRTTVKHLQVSGLYYESVTADLSDLGHIENRRGVKILGLFGLNMVKDFEIVIDIADNLLHLYRLDKNGNRIDPNTDQLSFDATQKVEMYNNTLLLRASINGKKLNFCLDTGAETNVIDNNLSDKVLKTIKITSGSSLSGVKSDKVEVLYGTMTDFSLGNKRLLEMQTIVANLENMGKTFGMQLDGMLGYDFFRQGIISINLHTETLGICFTDKCAPE